MNRRSVAARQEKAKKNKSRAYRRKLSKLRKNVTRRLEAMVIRDGLKKGLTYRQIGESMPDRANGMFLSREKSFAGNMTKIRLEELNLKPLSKQSVYQRIQILGLRGKE